MKKEITIVVVTYCSARYVIETLDAIYNQTYPFIHLIISDDQSPDDTVQVCQDWLDIHKKRFLTAQIIQTPKNLGAVGNCQQALTHITTELYIMTAGDDYLAPTHVEKCVEKYATMPEAGLVYTNAYLVLEKEGGRFLEEDISKFKEGYIFDDLLQLRFWPKSTGWMLRRDAVESVGGYNTDVWVEDYDLALRIASKYPIGWVDEYLTYYRLHYTNVGGESMKLIRAHIATIQKYKDYPLYEETMRKFEYRMIQAAYYEHPSYILKQAIKQKNKSYFVLYTKSLYSHIKQQIKRLLKR